jgi:hypothetical protein
MTTLSSSPIRDKGALEKEGWVQSLYEKQSLDVGRVGVCDGEEKGRR